MAKLINGIDFNLIENEAIVFENTSLQSFGYGIISQYVTTMKDLSIQAKGVYSYLVSFAGNDKQTYPSQSRMCSDLNIKKVDTLRKYIKELQAKGLIKIYKTKRNNIHYKNVYVIADDTRTVEFWKKEYLEDQGIKEVEIDNDHKNTKKEKLVIDENNEMVFEEDNSPIIDKNKPLKLSKLVHTEDYKRVYNHKMSTSTLFANATNQTRKLIMSQELRKLGYEVTYE